MKMARSLARWPNATESPGCTLRARPWRSPCLDSGKNDQNLVRANRWISAQGAIGDDKTQHAFANSAPKDLRHVHGPSLHAVITTDDFEAIPVIPISVAVMRRAGIPIVVAIVRGVVVPIAVAVVRRVIVPIIMANSEHAGFNEAALSVIEFAFLIPAISREDAQRLVFPDGRIPAHGLIIHRHSAVHAAAFDEVFENIADVIALVLETVISAL